MHAQMYARYRAQIYACMLKCTLGIFACSDICVHVQMYARNMRMLRYAPMLRYTLGTMFRYAPILKCTLGTRAC